MKEHARRILWLVASWGPALLLSLNLAVLWGLVARGGLEGVVSWYFLQLMPLFGLPMILGAVVAAGVRRRLSAAIVASLAVGLVAMVHAGALVAPSWALTFPADLETAAPAATVRLPTDVPMVVGWGGDHAAVNYHVIDPAQRWAYDLLVEPAVHGSEDLKDYGCWGIPVVAPATGTVVVAEDGHPDHEPGDLGDPQPTGNHVAIRMDDTGTHLLIAHLQEGSVAVSVGDPVAEGDLLGLCGNSGNTSEPHVHIHHQRQDPAELGPIGEGLPLYFRDHGGPPMPEGGLEVDGETVTLLGARVQHQE